MIMNKKIFAAFFAAQLVTQVYAGGDVEMTETLETEVAEVEESHFYIVVKGLASLGAEAEHEEAILDGDGGYGFGIDVGYRLGKGFALEYDFSYAKNTVTEIIEHHEPEEADAHYYTSSLDLIYTYEATETLGLFAKVGYEYEWETIDDLGIDGTDHGFILGAGVEVSLNEDYKLVAEYEHSTIDSPRGDSLYAGLMFNF
jgi:opacity protein-like surface antigen